MNHIKDVTLGNKAREEISEGVNILANAVKVTYGSQGRNVVIENEYGYPTITKDGVSVAKSITLSNPLQNIGAQLVKEVASKANDTAGDGTTFSTILAQSIFNKGMELIETGANPMDIKRGIDMALPQVLAAIKEQSTECSTLEDLINVATISANSDRELGELIGNAFHQVGENGIVTMESGKGFENSMEIIEGLQFDGGYASPYFAHDNEKGIVEFKDAYLVIFDGLLDTVKEIVPLLEQAGQQNKPLVIMANGFDDQVLATMVLNSVQGRIKSVAIKAPYYGEMRQDFLNDIATACGCNVFSIDRGDDIQKISNEHIGKVKKITVKKDQTVLVGEDTNHDRLAERVESIKVSIKDSTDKLRTGMLKERLAKLTGGIAVIKVGASSDSEMKEKKDRVEDAINATKAAMEDGITVGGGISSYMASRKVDFSVAKNDTQRDGMRVLTDSLGEGLKQIIRNAGTDVVMVLDEIMSHYPTGDENLEFGFNATTGEVSNLLEDGVIDPVKVNRSSIQAAASIAGLLLTTEAVVSIKTE